MYFWRVVHDGDSLPKSITYLNVLIAILVVCGENREKNFLIA